MSKLKSFFYYLVELEDTRDDTIVAEYVKVVEIDKLDFSAGVVANKEGVKLIKDKLKELGLTYNLVQIADYAANTCCNAAYFKILDIGI